MTFEHLIVQQRPHIDQVVRDLSRRHFLAAAEIEELRAAVMRALERNDFELLRAFDGRSTWETYLTTVITREFFLFQNALWGQWRPTPAAQRLGPAAVLLEELVVRDGLAVTQAVEVMRSMHRVDLPRHRIQDMVLKLHLTDASQSPGEPERGMSAAGANEALGTALREALAMLSPDDRLILELRYRDQQPLTRIAQMMKIEVRPLQRRIDDAEDVVVASLLTRGAPSDDVAALFEQADRGASQAPHRWWHTVRSRPSN